MLSKKNILLIDPQLAGISGDMFLGALLDLGANREKVVKTIKSLPTYVSDCKRIDVEITVQTRCEIKATNIKIKTAPLQHNITGKELIKNIEKVLEVSNLSDKAKNYVYKCLTTILDAEARIHHSKRNNVKLHETGSPDTLADIIGVATALDDLKIFENHTVYSLPTCIGKGKIETAERFFTVPAPATLEILTTKNFPFLGGAINGELTTPTGAALLTNIAKAVYTYPLIRPSKIGYGAGSRDFKSLPNVLRILYGKSDISLLEEKIVILETNVDDVTGETVGYLIEKLLKEGAKDAWASFSIGKKGRPLTVISAIVKEEQKEHLANLIFKETGTLGLRIFSCERMLLEKSTHTFAINIAGKELKVNVKVARDSSGRIIQIKPEYEHLKKLAYETGLPLRILVEKIRKTYDKSI